METALRRPLAAAAALTLLASSAPPALGEGAGAAGRPILVASAEADPEVVSLAEGAAEWLRSRLEGAGIPVLPRDATLGQGARGPLDAAQGLASAAGLGARALVLVDLGYAAGETEVRLRMYATASHELAAVARAHAPLVSIGSACEQSALALLGQLGVSARSAPPGPLLEELAASSRALDYRDRGEFARAWRELEGKLSPMAVRVRAAIEGELGKPGAALAERARVLAARGEAQRAWALIEPTVARADRGALELRTLLAAGEVELGRDNPRAARDYFERLLEREPDHADAQLGLARVLALQADEAGARRALTRAAKAEPEDPRPLALLAKLESRRPERRAQVLLRQSERAAARLDANRAEHLLEEAMRLDPALSARSWTDRARLRERLGRPAQALEAYRQVDAAGAADAGTWTGIGRVQRRLGNAAASETAYRKALALRPDDAQALGELGALYTERGRAREALPLLERAARTAPADVQIRRALARALRVEGSSDRALEALGEADESADAQREIASIHVERQELEKARVALLKAARVEPHDADIQRELARVHLAEGEAARAREALDLAELLDGVSPTAGVERRTSGGEVSFDELVASFSAEFRDSRSRRVAHLGLREARNWRAHLWRWLLPREPAQRALEDALDRAVAHHFHRVPVPDADLDALRVHTDGLYAFDRDSSLNAYSIAAVNLALGTDALFLSRLVPHPPAPAGIEAGEAFCPDAKSFELEVRLLSGQLPETASIAVAMECLPDGLAAHGVWNRRALAIYGLLFLALLRPLLRGWGSIEVAIALPPRTKGFFAIQIAKSSDKITQDDATKRKRFADRLRRWLRSLSRYRRNMAGRRTVFRWIPVRKRSYTVCLRGPLFDARNGEIIGHFLEERTAHVRRGRNTPLTYDLNPTECAIEVRVFHEGEPVAGARVAIQNDPSSFRYARDGAAFLYVGTGSYQVLLGWQGRVASHPVEVRSIENAIALTADLADEHRIVFQGCPAAVDPFLQGDYETCASALAEAGQTEAVHQVRALLHHQRGEIARAAEEYEAAGRLQEAAELRAANSDPIGAATLFEREGDAARAAEAFRAGGDLAQAARCYESAYDYTSALECYRELGATEPTIAILEKTGEYLEAATLAREAGDAERAIHNLQQIDAREQEYGGACVMLADLLSERGEFDVAAEKMEEAIRAAGDENAPLELHVRHAEWLEQAERLEEALQAYALVRRRDPQHPRAGERVAALRRRLDSAAGGAPSRDANESRYDLLEELGRGGMGVVYKARDKRLGRLVALKRLPESLRDHPAAVALFRREAQAAAALNHPNIVTLYDADEEKGVYFITMELLEGAPLSVILRKRRRLQPQDVARLGVQIAAGLHYAQTQNIVHRDIKAANLFFTADRVIKIMDFGLAKTIEEVRRNSTMIGGTPYYMAPEQAAGEAVDHRTDLYAFGVTLFQLVTGTLPFQEGDLTYHHRHTPAPDPRERISEIPDAMAELIVQLMAKDPEERCPCAADAGRRLQTILTGL